MSLDDADRLPFPPLDSHREPAHKPDAGRATTTSQLGTATEEVTRFGRQLIALHNTLRLTLAQAGRVLAVTTKPVGPPDPKADEEYDESDVMPVDEFGVYAANVAAVLNTLNNALGDVISDGADTFAAVKKGCWEE